jgi:two-component system phosphate regulon response regulator PhoB
MATRSVFLVEDERAVADMYRLGLETRGFDVSVHGDAPPFFEALETSLPDVVILDWNLPTLTGGEVLQRLRRDERTHRLRVFILSNQPKGNFAADVVSRLGALAWLEKTRTTPVELANVVAQAFEEFAGGAER